LFRWQTSGQLVPVGHRLLETLLAGVQSMVFILGQRRINMGWPEAIMYIGIAFAAALAVVGFFYVILKHG